MNILETRRTLSQLYTNSFEYIRINSGIIDGIISSEEAMEIYRSLEYQIKQERDRNNF